MEFRILGPLEVRAEGRELSLGGAKQRALLAVLLLHPNEVVSLDRLVDELWGDRPPATAFKVVQVYVSQLRKALRGRSGRGEEEQVLVTRAPGYMLRVEPGQLDADRFEELVDQARQELAAGRAQQAAHMLLEALALWRGPALADFALDAFAQSEIARLEEARISAVEERIEADLALGRHSELVGELESLVAAHPLRERLRGQLMLALYRCGRQAEALAAYRAASRLLDEELGLEPGDALKRLERGILEQDPGMSPVPSAQAPPAAEPEPPVVPVPTGTVSFLFTDIEDSTRLMQELGDDYGELLETHRRVLREAFEPHGGLEIDTQGDALFVAFRRARDAVAAAVAAQRTLAPVKWPRNARVSVRIGIHTGEPGVAERGYHGLDVVRAARISGAAHGGQILVSSATRDLVGGALPEVTFSDLGEHGLKGIDQPQRIFQVLAPGLREEFPPLRTGDGARVMTIRGREDELAAAAAAAVGAEDRRHRPFRRPRGAVILGMIILAGAAAGAVIGVLLTRGGGSVASASVKANAVGVIDSDSGKIATQIPVGAAPAGVAAGPDAIWVTNTDDQTVSQIDPRTNAVVQTVRVGAGPAGIAIGAGAVWVVNALDGTVSRIDPGTRAVVQTVRVGNGPTAIAYGLGALWVANGGDGTVSKIDPRSGDLVRTLGAGPGASGITVGFGSVWVTSERTGNVSRLQPNTGTVVRTINVGSGPRAVAAGAGSVWVANSLDGTVTRIDPKTNSVRAVISTAAGPSDIAVERQTVWVANNEGGSLTRLDAATDRIVRTVRLGNRPEGLALAGSSVLVAVRELGLTHRGGTLTVYSGRRGLQTIDPAISYESYSFAIPSLTSDGLVAFKYVGGSDGSTLVPDLASSLPFPTDAGKTYTFELRSGIRYSTGRKVRADDIRRAIERIFRVGSSVQGFFTGIAGGARCAKAPKTCDLSKGIAIDAAGRTVTFHLVAPDPDFLYKLTLPAANPVPPGVPNRDVGTRPVPGTGPYEIARYVPKRELVFVRNPFFRVWSQAAKPAGYPDRIVWRLDVTAAAATRSVEEEQADVAYDFVPPELLTEVKTRYASQLHVDPIPGTFFYLLDARLRPFNDVRVRRALNYAVDRDAVTEIAGAGVAEATCQVLPPNFPAYRPYCPYTANPSASGRWLAPDLNRAKRLVAASGTKGERVTVWAPDKAEGAYVATVLRALGYRTQLKTITPTSRYDAAIFDPRNKVQIAAFRWFADYPVPSGFISSVIFDCTYFCDRRIDRAIARAGALQVTDARAANALWARIDRDLTDQAPWLFLYSRKQADFVSSRVGNFQYNLRYGILLDQLWVK